MEYAFMVLAYVSIPLTIWAVWQGTRRALYLPSVHNDTARLILRTAGRLTLTAFGAAFVAWLFAFVALCAIGGSPLL